MRRAHPATIIVLCTVSIAFLHLFPRPRTDAGAAPGAAYHNGDVNGDGTRDLSDAVYLLGWLFQGGPEPVALAQEDELTASEVALLREVLQHVEVVDLEDGEGGAWKTIRFRGVNVQVVNGEGRTERMNGLGNLIVGYQALRYRIPPPGELEGVIPEDNHRTGSHNLIIGDRHNYTAVASLISGAQNWAEGGYCVVAGGANNRADGSSVVCGGTGNRGGLLGVVVGGLNNHAKSGGVVCGGRGNQAIGSSSAVSGGRDNIASGRWATVSGGEGLVAEADSSHVP